ncbi:MAG TPA: UDP-N-acetylglucosamine 1-carboxyvinyltransferase, partial [Tenacibaculum sp.]|nr:UDP-N-acetylglucosamine 1-carboxyvinyltransferase [Tenacibaculum sp.]
MASFKIEGGHTLKGSITPQGAKNEALQVLCAVLLTSEKVTLNNVPNILDVNKLIFILGELGVKIEKLSTNSYSFQSDELNLKYLENS